jgi:hypothetical protein
MVRLALCSIAVLGAVACIGGEVTGGEALPVIADMPDCTATGSACSTWTYLYACYFGPTGHANCSAQSGCHVSAASTGYLESLFMCGTTSDQCWTSMTGTSMLVHEPVTKFAMTNLNAALHKSAAVTSTGNNMPLENVDNLVNSAYLFTPADLACIGGWVTAGGKND